jgi:hypothetical protein
MKSNQVRIKIDFEDVPICDMAKPIKNADEFDTMVKSIKRKLFGK